MSQIVAQIGGKKPWAYKVNTYNNSVDHFGCFGRLFFEGNLFPQNTGYGALTMDKQFRIIFNVGQQRIQTHRRCKKYDVYINKNNK